MEFSVERDYEPRHGFENIELKGYFSVDKNELMTLDSSQLRYYIPQNNCTVHLNLNDDLKLIKRRHHAVREQGFDSIMIWIQKNYMSIQTSPGSERWLQPNFIFNNSVLVKLLRTPIDRETGWVFCAVKWRGTIYLQQFDTDNVGGKKDKKSLYYHSHLVWPKKFVQHVVSDTPNGSPLTHEPIDMNAGFHGIFQSRLGNHLLLYTNRMDAVCTNEILNDPLPLENLKFMQLQTASIINNDQQRNRFERYRSLKWWTLFTATGIKNILCGFTDEDRIVKKLKMFCVDDLPKASKIHWDSSSCLNFCDSFLTYVTNTVVYDYNQTIYKFERIPNGEIEVTEVLPFSDYAFLPEWCTRNAV